MICLKRFKMYLPVKSVLKCCIVKRFLLMAFHFPKFAEVYKNTSKDEHWTEFYVHLYVKVTNYCMCFHLCDIWGHLLPSEATILTDPLIPILLRSFSFLPPPVGMGIQSSNLKRIFWSKCDCQPSHLEMILGPDEEIANISQRRQEIPPRLLRFFFFFLFRLNSRRQI